MILFKYKDISYEIQKKKRQYPKQIVEYISEDPDFVTLSTNCRCMLKMSLLSSTFISVSNTKQNISTIVN